MHVHFCEICNAENRVDPFAGDEAGRCYNCDNDLIRPQSHVTARDTENRLICVFAGAIFVFSLLHYLAYAMGWKVTLAGLYVPITLLLSVVISVLRGITNLEGLYKGTKDLRSIGNAILCATSANFVISFIVLNETGDSGYLWPSGAIMMSSVVFLSLYLGKTVSGINFISLGYPRPLTRKGAKPRMKVKR